MIKQETRDKFSNLLKIITKNDTDIISRLSAMVDFIRPKNSDETQECLIAIDMLVEFFNNKSKESVDISNDINLFFIKLKISTNISSLGILSKNGFAYEIKERFYNKFLPSPPDNGELRHVFATLFNKKDDYIWVQKIDDEIWERFFAALFSNSIHIHQVKIHFFHELLYATEMMSVWIAAQEFDDSFVRLDKTLLNRDSAFIALQRDISKFVHKNQKDRLDIHSTTLDIKHLEVLFNQCERQIADLKKKSISLGISLHGAYKLERLKQILTRIRDAIELIKKFDTKEAHLTLVRLFKEAVRKNATKNSLTEAYKQSSRIIAKSITNNIGEHGEHYIADSVKEYIKMFLTSAGAGIIIAFMALLKIKIVQADFLIGTQTILSSLNYGLGFVFIHLIGFTVATKQPAMTASTFAQEVERDEDNKANQNRLIELIFKVARSQFASVMGNVALALLISFAISYFVINRGGVILSNDEAGYYLKNLEPLAPLLYAGIAGIWLFCSGLIAGYFDNRADCLQLKQRYFHHPLFKKLFKENAREKISYYLHDHHGAIMGNFIFGILLGITPFVGYLINLPLDIAHVAFSSAYLGYSSTHLGISTYEFLYYLCCVLSIGLVNLVVSFVIALKVSLVSRDTYIGNFFSFAKKLFLEILKQPHRLILPFKDNEKL
ncbi:hypothetical protein ACPF04_10045 [Campylobacter sp. MOP51]|uniref:hypothetical protein n=1 Tax=Campylobacter canis TaxID=3378588 RepID=UPI003C418A7F